MHSTCSTTPSSRIPTRRSRTAHSARFRPRIQGAFCSSRCTSASDLTSSGLRARFARLRAMRSLRRRYPLLMLCVCAVSFAQAPAKRVLKVDDLDRLAEVANPQVSPDGKWIAYTVSTVDRDDDKNVTSIWMVSWDGSQNVRLTYGTESASSPRWSPDGRSLSFVSSRAGKAKGSQIWLLDRRGGEARQLTHIKDFSISEYEWSPDSSKLLLVLRHKDEPEEEPKKGADPAAKEKPPKPVVIDRYHFKEDVEGYLDAKAHNHLFLFEIATEKLEPLT